MTTLDEAPLIPLFLVIPLVFTIFLRERFYPPSSGLLHSPPPSTFLVRDLPSLLRETRGGSAFLSVVVRELSPSGLFLNDPPIFSPGAHCNAALTFG